MGSDVKVEREGRGDISTNLRSIDSADRLIDDISPRKHLDVRPRAAGRVATSAVITYQELL